MSTRLTVLLALLLLLPGQALAQSTPPDTPEVPPAAPITWDSIPDLVGYVSFEVPAAALGGECSTAPSCEWYDVACQTARLYWLVADLFRQLVCLLLSLFQFIANALAGAINMLLLGLNAVWRFLIFAWLTIRSWLYGLWYLFEIFRQMWQAMLQFIAIVDAWLRAIAAIIVVLAGLVLTAVLLFLRVVLAFLSIIGYIGSVVLTILLAIVVQLRSPAAPSELSGTHVAYQVMRGTLEGLRDSSLGWLFILVYAMCYISLIFWATRFLSSSNRGGE